MQQEHLEENRVVKFASYEPSVIHGSVPFGKAKSCIEDETVQPGIQGRSGGYVY